MKATFIIAAVLVALVAATTVQAGWTVNDLDQRYSVLMGISFSDELNGFAVGGSNDEPLVILKSDDGLSTYTLATPAQDSIMLIAAASSSKDSAVVAGLGLLIGSGVQYTVDGTTFLPALIPGSESDVCTSQSAEPFLNNTKAYGVVGQFGDIDGPAVTFDSGATWASFNYSAPTPSRYGSFPAQDTFFVAGGEWPDDEFSNVEGVHRLSKFLHLSSKGQVIVTPRHFLQTRASDGSSKGKWKAVIQKTTDGGQTFERVFWDEGKMYFNEISCTCVENCWAVAEGDSGAWIYHTGNGGGNWTLQHQEGAGASLMAVDFVDEQNGWAGGLDPSGNGLILSTTDGGNTWTPAVWSSTGYYVTSLSFSSTSSGYATTATNYGFSGTARYEA